MKKPTVTTIEELHSHMIEVHKRIANLKKKNPDLSIYGGKIENVPLDLIFEVEALKNKDKSYVSSYDKMSQIGQHLTLSYYHQGASITLQSVKVKQAARPEMQRSDFEEVKEEQTLAV